MKLKFRKLSTGNYVGRYGKFYVFLRIRKHYVREGFETFRSWYTGYITKDKEIVFSEGVFGSSLDTVKKAKQWAKNKLSARIK